MSSYIHNKKISSSEYFERIRKSGRDQFTVMPEFGVTVYDAINAPFDRDSNKPVYAHLPSRESQIQKRGAYQANQSLTTMYKRKAPSNVYNNARFDAEFGPSAPVARKKARTELQMRAASQKAAWQSKNSLATQVRRLIAGKKKDAADQQRIHGGGITSTRVFCMSSSGAVGVANSGTGLIATDSDRAQLNYVKIRGSYNLRPLSVTVAQMAATFRSKCRVRHLVVWFYKSKTDPSAAGTLPPITEVLVSDGVDSLVVPETDNCGRFTILSDRMFDCGRNLIASDLTATQAYALSQYDSSNVVGFAYDVKINKTAEFKVNADPVTNLGGHYDSDVSNGQISKGLCVLYIVAEGGAGAAGTDVGTLVGINLTTRLNYTA